jgi:phosphoserine phosphatase
MAGDQHTDGDTSRTPRTAWLFDVDGVLTDPERKVVAEPALFDELIRRLGRGEPVGLNTGRSTEFIITEVLEPLERRVTDSRVLRGLIAYGEKGGAWIAYPDAGPRRVHVDASVTIAPALADAVRALVRRVPYVDTMFFDETKRTMLSIEMRAGVTMTAFATLQRQLVPELERIIAEYANEHLLRIDANSIATDVEYAHMGKGYAATRYVAELAAHGIRPQRIVCCGDSGSDYPMLDALLRLGIEAELVFVGPRQALAGMDTEHVTFTSAYYDRGTLAYLRAHG